MNIITNDPFEVSRRIHGEGSGVGKRGKQAFVALTRTNRGRIGLALLMVFLIMAVFGPALAPQDPNAASSFSTSAEQNLQDPSSEHLLGTDEQGRDVLSEVLYAARISLSVGVAAALISTILGAVCAYMLIGVVFGFTYALIGRIDPPFFAKHGPVDQFDYFYFSYACLTTVGFGDFVSRGDFGRSLSVLEAVLGQIFLVTLIARLVSLFKPPQRDAQSPRPE